MIGKNFNSIARVSQGLFLDFADKVGKQIPQLNLALDFLRPHIQALGLRIARLSRSQVEIVLPNKFRNRGSRGMVLEGAVVMAAVEALKWLWDQNKPDGNFRQEISKVTFEGLKPLMGELRLRDELAELPRETALLELANGNRSSMVMVVVVFDQDEQVVARVEVEMNLGLTPALQWT